MSNKKNFVIDGNIIGFGIESDYKQIKSFQDSLQIEEKEENNENENEDDNEYENNYYENENNDNDNIKEEVPPMMSMQFYSDVDIFLNRPPPKIKGITNNKSKIREKLEENIIKSTSLPIILTQQKQTKKIESKINTGRKGPGKKIERHIDQSLLQQAFEYTEKIQREAIENNINEIRETIPKKKSNSAPHNLSNRSKDVNSQDYSKQYNVYTNGDNYDDDEDYNDDEDNYDDEQNEVHSHDHHYQQKNKNKNIKTNSNSNSKSKNKKSGNLVKRLRSQTYTHQDQSDNKKSSSSSSSSFDTSLAVGDGGSQRQQVNYDDLIANFEQGITLKLLKKELEESKLSLERSNKAVEQISKEMSAKMRF